MVIVSMKFYSVTEEKKKEITKSSEKRI